MQDTAATAPPALVSKCGVRGTSNWSALLARSLVGFTVESDQPARFRGYLRNRKIADIHFIEMHTGRHTSHRSADDIKEDGRHDYLLCLQVAGVGEFSQDSRTAVLRPGDITIFDTARPTTVVSSANYQNVCMKFPHHLINLSPAQIGELTAARLGAKEGLAPAAGSLLMTLNQVMDTISGPSRYLAAQNALDLMTTMFRSQLDVTDTHSPSNSPLLLAQIQEYIEDHLADAQLSPGMVAASHYISLRQLHNVFQQNGLTVASWIRSRRLEKCKRDLLDIALESVPVAAIGTHWGFKTPSHFGRAFKDAYGMTPAEYRGHALDH